MSDWRKHEPLFEQFFTSFRTCIVSISNINLNVKYYTREWIQFSHRVWIVLQLHFDCADYGMADRRTIRDVAPRAPAHVFRAGEQRRIPQRGGSRRTVLRRDRPEIRCLCQYPGSSRAGGWRSRVIARRSVVHSRRSAEIQRRGRVIARGASNHRRHRPSLRRCRISVGQRQRIR